MTAPTESWSSRHDAAKDEAWRAWRRVDVEPYDLMLAGGQPPPALRGCVQWIATAITPLLLRVVDEVSAELDDEARRNIVTKAITSVVVHLPWSVVGAIADEMARPDPIPFDPPPAGSWVRCRHFPYSRREGRRHEWVWRGPWHLFSGDLQTGDDRTHDVVGRTRCGARLSLRGQGLFDGEPTSAYAVSPERPGEGAVCGRCVRILDGRKRPPIPDVFLY